MALQKENHYLTKKTIKDIFKKVNVTEIEPYSIKHYQIAFTHKSFSVTKELENQYYPNNERYEYHGDSLLGCIVGKYLFNRFEDLREGHLTKLRSKIVNGKTLSDLAMKLSFPDYLLLSKELHKKGRTLPSILENAFEAFVCAVYLDQSEKAEQYYQKELQPYLENKRRRKAPIVKHLLEAYHPSGIAYQKTEHFVIQVIETLLDFSDLLTQESNYKETLLKYFQKEFKDNPVYKEISVEGPPHKRKFTISVHHVDGKRLGTGNGKTKREAQQKASQKALQKLGLL